MSCLKMLFSPSWGIQDQMLMEKLKSWNALSNFPTTTAAAGIYVLKIKWCRTESRAFLGAKAHFLYCHSSARLKSCPFKADSKRSIH